MRNAKHFAPKNARMRNAKAKAKLFQNSENILFIFNIINYEIVMRK